MSAIAREKYEPSLKLSHDWALAFQGVTDYFRVVFSQAKKLRTGSETNSVNVRKSTVRALLG